jgi:hypothetical protein
MGYREVEIYDEKSEDIWVKPIGYSILVFEFNENRSNSWTLSEYFLNEQNSLVCLNRISIIVFVNSLEELTINTFQLLESSVKTAPCYELYNCNAELLVPETTISDERTILDQISKLKQLESFKEKLAPYVDLVHKGLGKTEEALKLRESLEKIHRYSNSLHQAELEIQKRDILAKLHASSQAEKENPNGKN